VFTRVFQCELRLSGNQYWAKKSLRSSKLGFSWFAWAIEILFLIQLGFSAVGYKKAQHLARLFLVNATRSALISTALLAMFSAFQFIGTEAMLETFSIV
jgi:hypothetical protein